jgi:hypothetical protein
MHVPKSGGTSVCEALARALPAGSIGSKTVDRFMFGDVFEDFDLLPESSRSLIALTDQDLESMRGSLVVAGHFCLASLTKVAPPAFVATVLREPRAQLLSLYAWWRVNSVELDEIWHPYQGAKVAERPLDEFLSEPSVAVRTDNTICRLLLSDGGRLSDTTFIDKADHSTIANAAIERLETLGFVGVLERGEKVWDGLSDFFGVRLEPSRSNATENVKRRPDPPGRVDFTPGALQLLEQRTGADAIVYERVLAGAGLSVPEIEALRGAAFANQLIRLGDLVGDSAARANALMVELDEHQRQIARLEAICQLLNDAVGRQWAPASDATAAPS